MKKSVLFFYALFLMGFCGWSQHGFVYYLETASDLDLGEIHQSSKGKQIRIQTASSAFDELINRYELYTFERAFPQAKSSRVNHLYRLVVPETIPAEEILQHPEIIGFSLENKPDLSVSYPNDYYDSIGNPDTALDLIRMPQAWQITKGDSTHAIVGIVDRGLNFEHEDLRGQIPVQIKLGNQSKSDHGTGISGVIAGNTNNGKGIAAAGYNLKLATVTGFYNWEEGLDTLSKVKGIRVINASWGICNPGDKRLEKLKRMIETLGERGVLVVAAAGNGSAQPCRKNAEDRFNGYRYPASYELDNVIGVTSVGHKFPIGNRDEKYYQTAWRDNIANSPLKKNPTTHAHHDKLDLAAPGHHVRFAKGEGYEYSGSGTSEATPYVAATAGLMFSVNPDLSAAEAQHILKSTADDISYIPYNKPFEGEYGAGRLNAYRAVLTAKCMADPEFFPNLDLMIKDAKDDFGAEPYDGNNYGWNSPDIWVRKNNDGKLIHVDESDQVGAKEKVYVYVRVTNRSCKTSSGKERIKLYWGKKEKEMPWPAHWNGEQRSVKRKKLGGEIGEKRISSLSPGEEVILEIPWKTPKVKDFKQTHEDYRSFYLVARVETAAEQPVEDSPMVDQVINSNNVAWRAISL